MRAVVRTLLFASLILGDHPLYGQKLGEVPRVAPDMDAPRGEVLEWTSEEGRAYWYRLPREIGASNPPNLVFMLHGTGLNHGWAFRNYPIQSGQFRGGDIVISPDGLTPQDGGTFNFVQGKEDGEQVAGLIRHFKRQFPIRSVYIYGHSQGAFFAYWFAGEYTELVDGIVAHAGNVLSVRHSELAKKKLAIGILHGKADAVVSVDCAHRSEKIYRDQGYLKIKLTIVEGLTAESGHWPLPVEVLEMMRWLDQASAASASDALDVAVTEIARPDPSLDVVADVLARARALLKGHRGNDRESLETRAGALAEFLSDAVAAHQRSLRSAIEADASVSGFVPWKEHFRRVDPACAASSAAKEWKKAMKDAIASARKQHEKVAAILRALERPPSAPALLPALEVWESCALAPNEPDLARRLREIFAAPPANTRAKDSERFQALAAARTAAVNEGRDRAATITREIAAAFRSAHPDLFPR